MPPRKDSPARAPVTAADVSLAARFAVAALGGAPAPAWGSQAGSLEWATPEGSDVAMIATTSPGTRAWHPQGTSDPEGFAAMGVTETLIHGHDTAQGLGVPFEPPADLPGRPRLGEWRWYSEPRP